MEMNNKNQRLGEKSKVLMGVFFQLVKTFLLSCFLILVLFPLLERSQHFLDLLQLTDKNTLLGITGLVLFFIVSTWSIANTFWWKYKNTYQATLTKFTHIDFIFSLVLFSLVLGWFNFNSDLKVSSEFKMFVSANSALLLLYFLSSYFWPKKKSSLQSLSRNPRDETSDEPIQYLDEDLLNRDVFVRGLYEEIKALNMTDSFVFGLFGNWGEGKTSVLNLLRVLLQYDDRFVVVSFEPWSFKDEEAMLKAFFSTLERSLNKEYVFPHLKKLLFKYQKLISSGLAGIGFNIDFGIEEETIDEIKQKIEGYIEGTGKKLLVIIDEIDRLEEQEIRMIFKLVRSNSKFKNSIFLLSLDDNKTTQKIDPNGREFLEKIIQKPISLPKAEHSYIDKFVLFSEHKIPQYTISEVLELQSEKLVSTFGYVTKIENGFLEITESPDSDKGTITVRLNKTTGSDFKLNEKLFVEGIFTKNEITLNDPESRLTPFKLSRIDQLLERMWRDKRITLAQIAHFDKEFVFLYRTQITNLIENFRDAKRFLNSLSSSYPAIAHEVSPFDFICLEVVKVFAKDIYNDIFESWWFYVDQRFEGDSLSNPYTFTFSSERDKRRDQTLQHVKKIVESTDLNEVHREAIRHVLDALFPKLGHERSVSESDRRDKRIYTNSFLKYFTLNVPSTELSDAFFDDELKTWKSKPDKANLKASFFKLQKQGKLVEFLDKIRRIYLEELPENLLPELLAAISTNVKDFSKRDMGDLWDSEYDRALMLVLRTLNLRIEKAKVQEEIKKIILSTTDMLFAVDLVLTTKKERNGDLYNIYDNIDHQTLRKALAERLEKYFIDGKKNVLHESKQGKGWLRILYQWSSNWSEADSPYKAKVSKYMVSIFKDDPKSLVELLKSFNAGMFGDEWNMDYNQYSKVYDLKPLVELAKKHLKEKSLDDEQRDILTKFVSIMASNSEEKGS